MVPDGRRAHSACRSFFPADGGPDLFAPAHPGKPHVFHQLRDGASGHAEALPQQLAPDLANTIDAVVFVVHALYLLLQLFITLVAMAASVRMQLIFTVAVV